MFEWISNKTTQSSKKISEDNKRTLERYYAVFADMPDILVVLQNLSFELGALHHDKAVFYFGGEKLPVRSHDLHNAVADYREQLHREAVLDHINEASGGENTQKLQLHFAEITSPASDETYLLAKQLFYGLMTKEQKTLITSIIRHNQRTVGNIGDKESLAFLVQYRMVTEFVDKDSNLHYAATQQGFDIIKAGQSKITIPKGP